jgi:hypothetical protein
MFTRACHWSPSSATWIQSTPCVIFYNKLLLYSEELLVSCPTSSCMTNCVTVKLFYHIVPVDIETVITLHDEFFYPMSTEISVLFVWPSFHCFFSAVTSSKCSTFQTMLQRWKHGNHSKISHLNCCSCWVVNNCRGLLIGPLFQLPYWNTSVVGVKQSVVLSTTYTCNTTVGCLV